MDQLQVASPRLLAFEVTTRCNLKCAMCPHGINAVDRPRDASHALLEAVWPTMEKAETVHLNGVGEPMLADIFWDIVERLEGRSSPRIDFNTNGLLFSERNLDRLKRAPLGRVYVSIDAADQLTYRHIRGGSYEKVVARTKRAAEVLGPSSDFRMTFVVMRENLSQTSAFVSLAAEIGVRGVTFGFLTDPSHGMRDWTVARPDGWVFDYAEQKISVADPDLQQTIRAAVTHGHSLGITVECPDAWGWA